MLVDGRRDERRSPEKNKVEMGRRLINVTDGRVNSENLQNKNAVDGRDTKETSDKTRGRLHDCTTNARNTRRPRCAAVR